MFGIKIPGMTPAKGLEMIREGIEKAMKKPIAGFSIQIDVVNEKMNIKVGERIEPYKNSLLFSILEGMLKANIESGIVLQAAEIIYEKGKETIVNSFVLKDGEKLKVVTKL